ncbi:MAG: lipocalin family protein [Rubricella sp.]
MRPILAAILLFALAACGEVHRDTSVSIEPVETVDLDRYAGRWYEIARYPNWFEEGCVGVTADYALRDDSRIDVTNTCRRGTLDGEVDSAQGIARVVEGGALEVTFTPWLIFVWGDYWIIHLEPDYSLAVIGSPSGRTGWILARDPQPDPDALARGQAALEAAGYSLDGLEYPAQFAAPL